MCDNIPYAGVGEVEASHVTYARVRGVGARHDAYAEVAGGGGMPNVQKTNDRRLIWIRISALEAFACTSCVAF